MRAVMVLSDAQGTSTGNRAQCSVSQNRPSPWRKPSPRTCVPFCRNGHGSCRSVVGLWVPWLRCLPGVGFDGVAVAGAGSSPRRGSSQNCARGRGGQYLHRRCQEYCRALGRTGNRPRHRVTYGGGARSVCQRAMLRAVNTVDLRLHLEQPRNAVSWEAIVDVSGRRSQAPSAVVTCRCPSPIGGVPLLTRQLLPGAHLYMRWELPTLAVNPGPLPQAYRWRMVQGRRKEQR